MTTKKKRAGTPTSRGTSGRADIREAATVLFVHSRAFRDLTRLVALAGTTATLAEDLARRIPALRDDGAFEWMLFPDCDSADLTRCLEALSYIGQTVADAINSQLPPPPARGVRPRRATKGPGRKVA